MVAKECGQGMNVHVVLGGPSGKTGPQHKGRQRELIMKNTFREISSRALKFEATRAFVNLALATRRVGACEIPLMKRLAPKSTQSI